MDAISHGSRKPLLVLAASYSFFTPIIVAVVITIFYFVLYQIEVVQNRTILSRQAFGDIMLVPFFILISSLILGVVSLFGIIKHGVRPILLKAIVGILGSLGVGFLVFILIAMSSIIC